jgi:hypothetical protein
MDSRVPHKKHPTLFPKKILAIKKETIYHRSMNKLNLLFGTCVLLSTPILIAHSYVTIKQRAPVAQTGEEAPEPPTEPRTQKKKPIEGDVVPQTQANNAEKPKNNKPEESNTKANDDLEDTKDTTTEFDAIGFCKKRYDFLKDRPGSRHYQRFMEDFEDFMDYRQHEIKRADVAAYKKFLRQDYAVDCNKITTKWYTHFQALDRLPKE